MSGTGGPRLTVDGTGLRVAVVAASWHEVIMNGLLGGARRGLRDAAVDHALMVRVPGTFELPVAATRLATDPHIDAVIALGVVIRGGTPHFDYICQAATSGLTQVSVRTGIPIGFGVLTCENEQQALDRAGLPGSTEDKGQQAATAAVATALALRPWPQQRCGPDRTKPGLSQGATAAEGEDEAGDIGALPSRAKPIPGWLSTRLIQQAGISEGELAGMAPERAMDVWDAWMSRPRT